MLKRSLIQIFVRTIIPPAAVPWIERPVINLVILVEDAHMTDPIEKITTLARRIFFRPQISESFAHTGVAAALVKR
jgi:hypothetical protein